LFEPTHKEHLPRPQGMGRLLALLPKILAYRNLLRINKLVYSATISGKEKVAYL
jgi:hypothetical protein